MIVKHVFRAIVASLSLAEFACGPGVNIYLPSDELPQVCVGITCSNHGTCVAANGQPHCNCEFGYTNLDNVRCVVDPFGPCAAVTCSGHGDCVVENELARCECEADYYPSGLTCLLDPCIDIDCSGHGDCVVEDASARCDCEADYYPSGLACLADPCIGVGCSGHGECGIQNGAAKCLCETTYVPEGLECIFAPMPTASFALSAPSATIRDEITLDAAQSTGRSLEYRWDFEADGQFDTAWLQESSIIHRWYAPADFTVALEVRDAAGQVASVSRPLTIQRGGTASWLLVLSGNSSAAHSVSFELDGTFIQDEEIRASSYESSSTDGYAVYQGADGQVLAGIWCMFNYEDLGCLFDEVSSVGKAGKGSVWSQLPQEYEPTGLLELADGSWLVSSRSQNAIRQFDVASSVSWSWAQAVSAPQGMALSPDGTKVLVVVSGASRIDAYDLQGTRIGRWDEPSHLSSPDKIIRLSSGDYLVSDRGGGAVEFDENGLFVKVIRWDPMTVTTGLAELPDGRILIGETCQAAGDDCGSILSYNPSTEAFAIWVGNSAPNAGILKNPEGMVVVYE
ncbi:MAG: hypothetical protein A2289_03555 [Deltaproteobacteria bacterium RIFOXYA12_FULL_58_15]|nr:MAG: hypothetical protein A2289_03555 [Deltaproteobacteria bacterium RIFOXYA12_FULL_58_15]OGR13318.1 MAG: hypothetical protein A2341_02330 [Deltaproteobacteria bacterium RIFOXYB12_FULL_58_9]